MWEYNVVGASDICHTWGGGSRPDPDKLNEFGKGGWELVAIVNSSIGPQWIFKRPLADR